MEAPLWEAQLSFLFIGYGHSNQLLNGLLVVPQVELGAHEYYGYNAVASAAVMGYLRVPLLPHVVEGVEVNH